VEVAGKLLPLGVAGALAARATPRPAEPSPRAASRFATLERSRRRQHAQPQGDGPEGRCLLRANHRQKNRSRRRHDARIPEALSQQTAQHQWQYSTLLSRTTGRRQGENTRKKMVWTTSPSNSKPGRSSQRASKAHKRVAGEKERGRGDSTCEAADGGIRTSRQASAIAARDPPAAANHWAIANPPVCSMI